MDNWTDAFDWLDWANDSNYDCETFKALRANPIYILGTVTSSAASKCEVFEKEYGIVTQPGSATSSLLC